jgi:hypothetical protein
MPDFNVHSDSVKVEQIMEQIRARIREKRGVDYTEQQIRELAAVKLEKFLDPKGVRSDLLEQFRRAQPIHPPPDPGNYAFGEHTLYESHRAPLRWIRRLLRPVLKLFFNPNPLIQALHIQSQLNTTTAKREAARDQFDQLHYEVMHNLVIEATRMGIEIKNLKMRVESLTSRLEFNERRARALESVVAYEPVTGDRISETPPPLVAAVSESAAPAQEPAAVPPEGPGQRSRRRRRRRGRRGGGSAVSIMGAGPGPDVIPAGQPTTMRSDTATAPPELPEPAPPPSASESRRTEPLDQGTPLAGAGPDDTGRGAGEPDGER